ncbi:Cro/C1-type HTH DNA-binding domain-containing protein [Pilibacter termitis]|uniref:Cro/C1-type HTH DNA-binding domain-containing protein n=1 Tax=Pilibacter termitis TaxID=263852 RepID=A0A1T4L423_9ENTE|nr:helix-turn-helix domain-containing protein [Pilibacter termitis]SJZ49454.1 Cro/C1-type HTH DNA-binding domain-containing protein [Pilibacter termitis]
MMNFTEENKRALRRVMADNFLTKRAIAQKLGMSEKTIQQLTRNDKPQEVKKSTYQKLMQFISENY